jgi:uncharacterized protein (TIGR02145 family)
VETRTCPNNASPSETQKIDKISYNPSTEFCQAGTNTVKNLCGTEDYTEEKYCSNGTIKTYGTVSDGVQNYKTVVIGTQTWMAENLNYNATGSKCYAEGVSGVSPDSIAKNCAKYGRLYDWATAMSACPSGWHLPSDADWNALMKVVNPICSDNSHCANAGTELKAAGGWGWNGNNGNGTDKYGFSALPGGYVKYNGDFDGVGYYGDWWSSSDVSSMANYREMKSSDANVDRYVISKSYLYSVRCVMD